MNCIMCKFIIINGHKIIYILIIIFLLILFIDCI